MRRAALLLAAATGSCVVFAPPSPSELSCIESANDNTHPPLARMNVADPTPFAAPYPALGRAVGLPANTALAWRLKTIVPRDGYATTAAIFFPFAEPLASNAALPAPWATPDPDRPASVVVFPLGAPRSPAPINVTSIRWWWAHEEDGRREESFLVSALPVQGIPLEPNRDYVAIVRSSLARPAGEMTTLCGGGAVVGIADPDKYRAAIADAASVGIACNDIASMTVFHTTDPTVRLRTVARLARTDWDAAHGASGCDRIHLTRERGEAGDVRCPVSPFCVYSGTVRVPVYQRGTPPYFPYVQWHGGWPEAPIPARAPRLGCGEDAVATDDWTPEWRTARVVVTIPRTPPKTGRYPVLTVVRTGGGSATDTLVDRGPLTRPTCRASACRGPAEELQSIGFAGLSIDGPLAGQSRKEPLELDEDLGVFDFLNPEALRDNIRESAVELALVPRIAAQIDLDLSECEGAGAGAGAVLDPDHLALFSHSMGSTVAPLALSVAPEFRAAILSGSGGSLIENVLFKKQPVPINAAAALLGYSCAPTQNDPSMSLMQWSLEASDPPVYARRMVLDPTPSTPQTMGVARHVLMIQGMIDHYIPAPIADTMTLAEGLTLAIGPRWCQGDARCDRQPVFGEVYPPPRARFPSLVDLLPLVGSGVVDVGASAGRVTVPANVAVPPGFPRALTAVLLQHRIDENREADCPVDGHEVVYESRLARHQWACFLSDFAKDQTPRVRPDGEELSPCD